MQDADAYFVCIKKKRSVERVAKNVSMFKCQKE